DDPRKKQWHALSVRHRGRGRRPPIAGARVGGRGSETMQPHVVVTASDQIRTNVHYLVNIVTDGCRVGNRTRVYGPPRALISISQSSAKLNKHADCQRLEF